MAQDDDLPPYEPITEISLGVESLNLSVGESYTFQVTYVPEDTVLTTLNWFVSDESVISLDPYTFTVTALKDGEARIFAESFDQFSYAVCTVTVGDSVSKGASVMKSGSEIMGLTPEEMDKITAETLVRYLSFVGDSPLDETSYAAVTDRFFDVLAAVRPGTEEEQSRLALSCGVEESDPLPDLHTITLRGSVAQILAYVKDNKDLLEVFEMGPFLIEEPAEEDFSSESVEKAVGGMNLGGNTQPLTNINYAHSLGLTGKGRTIAIIDSGLYRNHPEFLDAKGKSRVVAEVCYSSSGKDGIYTYKPVCRAGSSSPSLAKVQKNFTHGSHVAGIAAGRSGIAPDAKIVMIQNYSEKIWRCKDAKERKRYGLNGGNQCYSTILLSSNTAKAYQYVISQAKSGKLKIDALNMSYSSREIKNSSAGTCDNVPYSKRIKSYFTQMNALGILPIASAGNNYTYNRANPPSCISNVYSIAALSDLSKPQVSDYSNISRIADLAAPGTHIRSAVYQNKYEKKDGTSMATPMVTGAIALVRQLYPGRTSQQAGQFLKDISNKWVYWKAGRSAKMDYPKPVLNFSNILKKYSIPDDWITAEGKQISIKLDRVSLSSNYSVRLIDLKTQAILPVSTKVKHSGNYTYIDVSSTELKTGNVYRMEVTRFIRVNNKVVGKATVVKYVSPFESFTSLTAVPKNKGVNLNVYMYKTKNRGVQYSIYNPANNRLIKRITVDGDSKAQTVTGYVNGISYYVTAKPYMDTTINKTKHRLWGKESQRVYFTPMNNAVNCSYSVKVPEGSVVVSCTAAPMVSGIKVIFRSKDGSIKNGCEASAAQKFTCTVPGSALSSENGKYQLIVMNYRTVNGVRYYSGGDVICRDFPKSGLGSPEKVLIYVDGERVVVSAAENKSADGIRVLKINSDGSIEKFCESRRRSCDGRIPAGSSPVSFYVMRYKITDGLQTHSPGVVANYFRSTK